MMPRERCPTKGLRDCVPIDKPGGRCGRLPRNGRKTRCKDTSIRYISTIIVGAAVQMSKDGGDQCEQVSKDGGDQCEQMDERASERAASEKEVRPMDEVIKALFPLARLNARGMYCPNGVGALFFCPGAKPQKLILTWAIFFSLTFLVILAITPRLARL